MTQPSTPEAVSGNSGRQPQSNASQGELAATPLRRSGIGAATMVVPPARDLHPAKALLLERAYNDFCKLREQGDTPDPDQFCDRFPSIRSAVIRMMLCHLHLADNTALAGKERGAILWPDTGETFLDFHLLQELGSGFFARVFLAAEPKLGNRLVALKIARDGGPIEAKLLGRLMHPNIVPIYSIQDDTTTGLTAVCMPYVGSATLNDVLEHVFSQPTPKPQPRHILDAVRELKHPLDGHAALSAADPFLQDGTYVDAIRSLGAQLADALAFIHGLGICHRDLKPSNVLMSPQGVPMLLDFNLSTGVKDVNVHFGGTLPNMSPEQLQAVGPDGNGPPITLDARSDIFSFGVILFQLLTGRHPYGPVSLKMSWREMWQQLRQGHLDGAQSPRLFNPDIDPAFSQLIERCLAYNPSDRPQSAAAIAKALRSGLTPQRRAGRWISRRPRTMVAGLLLCLTIGLVGAAAVTVVAPRHEHPLDAGVQLFEQKQYAQAREKFSQAIAAEPKDVAALIARGQNYQQMGATEKIYWQYALDDFVAAEKLKQDARTSACIGYCILQTDGPIEWARQRFQSAIDDGFASAEVYNNLGYCQQKQNKLADAKMSLDRAIELNPRMQAAYFTRGNVHFEQAFQLANELARKKTKGRENDVPRDAKAIAADIVTRLDAGIQDVEKAVEIGPTHASLNYLAARLYAAAAEYGHDTKDAALKHLSKAVTGGRADKQLDAQRAFKSILGDKQFHDMCKTAVLQQRSPHMVCCIDPLKGCLR
jgi:eukaryotic-like serine/threonine-protein kinase